MATETLTPIEEIGKALAPALTDAEVQDASQQTDWHLSLLPKKPREIYDRVYPTDPWSGLPLLIVGEGYDKITARNTTKHHGWFPSDAALFKTPAGAALRASFLEVSPDFIHNKGKRSCHARLNGPLLPTHEDDIYSRIILATAGYIPRRVIDLDGDVPVERDMTVEEFEFFSTPNSEHTFGYEYVKYGYEAIRPFIRNYVIGHRSLSVRLNKKVADFLETDCPKEKRELGHLLLAKSAEASAKKVQERYSLFLRIGLLQNLMPNMASTLIKNKLGTDSQREELIPELEAKLKAQRYEAA